MECSECECDLRGGHDPGCSRFAQHSPNCKMDPEDEETVCTCTPTYPNKAN